MQAMEQTRTNDMAGLSSRLAETLRRSLAGRCIKKSRRFFRMRYAPLRSRPAQRTLFPQEHDLPHGGWTYHDENWVRVIHRHEHRRLLAEGRSLSVVDNPQEPSDEVVCGPDGSIVARVPPGPPQRWVWLHLDPVGNLWRDFRWDMTVRRDSAFRELQFGFRYLDFYNRYRFRHEDEQLHFDIVVNGAFRNSIHSVPFPMTLGRDYRYTIEARDNRFVLAVDGQVMLDEVDRERLFPRGSIAVIFWESDNSTPVAASIRDIRVVET
jgi:hypothetical protein